MLPLKDTNPIPGARFWVVAIILFNLYIFAQELLAQNPADFIIKYALIPSQINFSNLTSLYSFITSQFIHGGFIHVLSNMLFLWVFGRNVEAVLGFSFFPVFFILSGIVAGLTQYSFMPTDPIPVIGASGAVAGVLGAYFALFPHHKIKTLVFIFIFITIIDIPAYFLLFYWFITQLFSSVASITLFPAAGGEAFLAHVGGFLFGWLAAIIISPRRTYSYHLR